MMSKPRVFISYSSKDRPRAEAIHQGLEAAGFYVWRDQTRLETDWSREIAFALAESDLLCLLWSENSATSKWVKHEWLTARALEKRIIACLSPNAPELPEPLYNLHGVSFASIDEVCRTLIKRIRGAESFFEKYDYTILPRNSFIPFNPNPHFTGRHADLLELYLKMIGNLKKIGINQVGTVGMGGIGKTQLAVEFAYRFSYGFHAVYWIQAADPDNWLSEFLSIARDRLRREIKDFDILEGDKQVLLALQGYFKDHPNTLLVMDNVAEPKLLNNDSRLFGLTPLTLGCDLLFTTRQHFQLHGVSSQAVNVLLPEAAYHLLASYRQPMPDEVTHARAICSAVGFLPLAITLVGAYLAKYSSDISFADYYDELSCKILDAIDIGEMSEEDLATRHVAAVTVTLLDHWRMLKNEDAQHLFRLAGQFPEAAIIPKARLGLLAGIGPGHSKIDQPLAKAFNNLHDLCLVERLEEDTRTVRLHPLVHEFSHQLVTGEEQDQFRSTAARRLNEALFVYTCLETELRSRGVEELIVDIETGLDWWGNDGELFEELKLLRGALHLSSSVLSQDPYQLATQLIGRLLEKESQGIEALLEGARKSKRGPWLSPLQASLTQPGGPLIRTLVGHASGVYVVAVTPDGRFAVSGSYDNTLKVWDLETGREIRNLIGHTGPVHTVAVTPDGRRAVSGSYDKTLKVWDLETGKEIRNLIGHTDSVNTVAVTPDGRRAVSGSGDNTLKVWDLETGKEIRNLIGHTDSVNTVAVTPDGRRAVSGSYDNELKVWDLETGKAWNLETGKEIKGFEGHTHSLDAVAVTPDGRHVVSGSRDSTLKVWDLQTGGEIKTLAGHTGGITAVAVTSDGRRAVSGSSDNTLKVWDLETGMEIRSFRGHADGGTAVAVTPNGRRAVSGALDSTLKVWDLETGMEIRSFEGHTDSVVTVAVMLDGLRAVTGSSDSTLKIWDMKTSREIKTLAGHTDGVNTVAVTPDGRRAVSGSSDSTLKVWDLETGMEIRNLIGHTSSVNTVAVTPDGRRAVSGSNDNTLRIWDMETGREIKTLAGHTDGVTAVAVTPDGRLAVSGSTLGALKVWELETGRNIRTFDGYSLYVNAVAVTADGKRAVSAGSSLRIWDLETGQEIRNLTGHHTDWVSAATVTPDGRRVVSGSRDNRLILWDIESGEPLDSFWGDSGISACAVSPAGNRVIVGETSGRIHILRLME